MINVVHGPGATTGLALAEHPGINGISFTGSTEVGRVMARVGAERLIKVQLELGGKNASIVLDDADLDHAADQIAIAALSGSGQQCTATSRILVQRSVLDAFTERMLDRVEGVAARARRPRRRAPGAAGLRAAAADGLRVRRGRPRRGRHAAARRRAPGRRAGQRLVRGGHGLRRRDAGHAHRPRGDLRARDRDPADRHGRGGDRDRQRLALRPLGGGLHAGAWRARATS